MGAAPRDTIHATAICLGTAAALIRGPSGSGKSDLALRCLATAPSAIVPRPVELIADDWVEVEARDGALHARAPAAIRGKIEVRGVGILEVPVAGGAQVALVIDLVNREDIERLPDPMPTVVLLGVTVPLIRIEPLEASAPIKVILALARAAAWSGSVG